ncbi:hypothetical protein Q5530_16645 [Saccharothrix sp. BKS2]|uniref:hypothetical protein n=1 Tax=Saccharothrix sp. BKS2 TaxID=3064400 RepID=UPI0039ED49B1
MLRKVWVRVIAANSKLRSSLAPEGQRCTSIDNVPSSITLLRSSLALGASAARTRGA